MRQEEVEGFKHCEDEGEVEGDEKHYFGVKYGVKNKSGARLLNIFLIK